MGFLLGAGAGLWGYILVRTMYLFLNLGILYGLTFGALILMRPITNRLLPPSHRVWLWYIGWCGIFLFRIAEALGRFPFLPFSFRDLITPRTVEHSTYRSIPMYLPDVGKPGDYTIALPGGTELPVHINVFVYWAMLFIFVGVSIAAMIYCFRQEHRLRQIGQQGVKLTDEEKAVYGLTDSNIVVRVCKNLPTSFVRLGHDTGTGDGVRYVVCVQEGLSNEQMRLVMLHEAAHLKHFHVYWNSVITTMLFAFYWWNPILWIAYRLTRRDMELACDEAVMEQLNEADRREYARMLVELGVGTPMWGSITSFGECDTALRVRRIVHWKPRARIRDAISVLLTIFMVLFFYCGSLNSPQRESRFQTLDWINYATGSGLIHDLNSISGHEDWDLRARWELPQRDTQFSNLYLLDQEGNWFLCCCVPYYEEYYVSSLTKLRNPPDLTNCIELVIPTDWEYP